MRSPCPRSWMAAVASPRFAMPSTDIFTAANVSTPGSAPTASLSQYVRWPLVMLRLSICSGCRIAASASCTMSGLFTNGFDRLVTIDQRIEGGAGKVDRPGPVRLSLEQFAIRQAQHSALRYDHMKPRRSKVVRREECFVSDQRPQFGPFGDQFRTRHRRSQPRAADSVVRLGEFHIEIRRLETGLGEDISQSSLSPKKLRPANARQRNPTDLERRVGCTQGDGLSDQAIGAQRVIQFADPQRAPWMRLGKCSLYLPFAIAVEDRTTEHKDEHRDGEDERTKAKPPRRQAASAATASCSSSLLHLRSPNALPATGRI